MTAVQRIPAARPARTSVRDWTPLTTRTVPVSQILYNQAIIDGIITSNKVGHVIEINIPEI